MSHKSFRQKLISGVLAVVMLFSSFGWSAPVKYLRAPSENGSVEEAISAKKIPTTAQALEQIKKIFKNKSFTTVEFARELGIPLLEAHNILEQLWLGDNNLYKEINKRGHILYCYSEIGKAVHVSPTATPKDVSDAWMVAIGHSEGRQWLGITPELMRQQADEFLKAGIHKIIYIFGDFPEVLKEKVEDVEGNIVEKEIDYLALGLRKFPISFEKIKEYRSKSPEHEALYKKAEKVNIYERTELESTKEKIIAELSTQAELKYQIEILFTGLEEKDVLNKIIFAPYEPIEGIKGVAISDTLAQYRLDYIRIAIAQAVKGGRSADLIKFEEKLKNKIVYGGGGKVNEKEKGYIGKFVKAGYVGGFIGRASILPTAKPGEDSAGNLAEILATLGGKLKQRLVALFNAKSFVREDQTVPSPLEFIKAYKEKGVDLKNVHIVHVIPELFNKVWKKTLQGEKEEVVNRLLKDRSQDSGPVEVAVRAGVGVAEKGPGAYTYHTPAQFLKKAGVKAAVLNLDLTPETLTAQLLNLTRQGITPLVHLDKKDKLNELIKNGKLNKVDNIVIEKIRYYDTFKGIYGLESVLGNLKDKKGDYLVVTVPSEKAKELKEVVAKIPAKELEGIKIVLLTKLNDVMETAAELYETETPQEVKAKEEKPVQEKLPEVQERPETSAITIDRIEEIGNGFSKVIIADSSLINEFEKRFAEKTQEGDEYFYLINSTVKFAIGKYNTKTQVLVTKALQELVGKEVCEEYYISLLGFVSTLTTKTGKGVELVNITTQYETKLKTYLDDKDAAKPRSRDFSPNIREKEVNLGNLVGTKRWYGANSLKDEDKVFQMEYNVGAPQKGIRPTLLTLKKSNRLGSRGWSAIVQPKHIHLIVGFGTIGKQVAEYSRKLGYFVVAGQRTPNEKAGDAQTMGIPLYLLTPEDEKTGIKGWDKEGIGYEGTVQQLLASGEVDLITDATDGEIEEEGITVAEWNMKNIYSKAPNKPKIMVEGGEDPKSKILKPKFFDIGVIDLVKQSFKDKVKDVEVVFLPSCNTSSYRRLLDRILFNSKNVVVKGFALRRYGDPYSKGKLATDGMELEPEYHHNEDALIGWEEYPEIYEAFAKGDDGKPDFTAGASTTHLTKFHIIKVTLTAGDDKKTGNALTAERVKELLSDEKRLALVAFKKNKYSVAAFANILQNQMKIIHPFLIIVQVVQMKNGDIEMFMAVPQESVVIANNMSAIHALSGLWEREASVSLVDDVLELPRIAQSIENSLPLKSARVKPAVNWNEVNFAKVDGAITSINLDVLLEDDKNPDKDLMSIEKPDRIETVKSETLAYFKKFEEDRKNAGEDDQTGVLLIAAHSKDAAKEGKPERAKKMSHQLAVEELTKLLDAVAVGTKDGVLTKRIKVVYLGEDYVVDSNQRRKDRIAMINNEISKAKSEGKHLIIVDAEARHDARETNKNEKVRKNRATDLITGLEGRWIYIGSNVETWHRKNAVITELPLVMPAVKGIGGLEFEATVDEWKNEILAAKKKGKVAYFIAGSKASKVKDGLFAAIDGNLLSDNDAVFAAGEHAKDPNQMQEIAKKINKSGKNLKFSYPTDADWADGTDKGDISEAKATEWINYLNNEKPSVIIFVSSLNKFQDPTCRENSCRVYSAALDLARTNGTKVYLLGSAKQAFESAIETLEQQKTFDQIVANHWNEGGGLIVAL